MTTTFAVDLLQVTLGMWMSILCLCRWNKNIYVEFSIDSGVKIPLVFFLCPH